MEIKKRLAEGEYRFAALVWANEPLPSGQLVRLAADALGWKKSTTYTVLKKLEAKGFIRREDPGFVCVPLVSRDEMQKKEAATLVRRVFGGSRKALFSALLEDEPLSEEEIEALRELIDRR